MTADILREAAAKMRERAEAATPGPWEPFGSAVEVGCFSVAVDGGAVVADPVVPVDAEHIASWHPAVALTVADLLDNAAQDLDMQGPDGELKKNWDMRVHIAGETALAVARAFLGRDA